MGFLWALSSVLVLYGTLYPFDFMVGAHPGDIIDLFAASLRRPPGRGDVLSNVVLFLPFGFFAMQSLLRVPRLLRLILVVLFGTALSLAIECTQSYLPDRVTSVSDLALNAFGSLVGAIAGWADWRGHLARMQGNARQAAMFPLLLLAAWLGYRLFPYVPTIDLQHVKNALKPIFSSEIPPVDVLRYVVVTLVVGRLLQALTTPGQALIGAVLIPIGVVAAKPFIMTKVIAPAEVVGVAIGVVLWVALLARMHRRTGLIAVLLFAQIIIQGVLPFELRDEPVMMSLIPMKGLEGGSMAMALQSFFEKVFLYGALVWLLVEAGRGLVFTLVASTLMLTMVELLQMFLVGRSPEITDPLLAIVMGIVFYAVDRHGQATQRPVLAVRETIPRAAPQAASSQPPAASSQPMDHQERIRQAQARLAQLRQAQAEAAQNEPSSR